MIRGLQNVYVVVTDVEEAVRFYRDVLGLPLKFQDGGRWAEFEVAGASFSVGASGEGPATPGGGAVPVFEVESLEDAFAALQKRGLAIEGGLIDMGAHGRYFTVRDPPGNSVLLFQRVRS